LAALKDQSHPKHDEIDRWFRREQASLMTKKFIAGMEVGLAGINMGNTGDWLPLWDLPSEYQKSTAPLGLIAVERDGDRLALGEPRPAYYTLRLLTRKLQGVVTGVHRLSAPPGVYAYRMTTSGAPIHVIWYDDTVTQPPGEPPARLSVDLTVDVPLLEITHLITEYGREDPQIERVPAEDGRLRLDLQEFPVFIEGTKTLSVQ
jgi:hypothetical protein